MNATEAAPAGGPGPASRPFHVMAKPIGPSCNLRCTYCFYLEKDSLFPPRTSRRMSDETLELFVRQYIEAQPGDRVVFAWQGGEPTLLGVEWFRKALALQRRHAGGRTIENTLQTNGTLLDDAWGSFLREHDFLVGISIDGPREIHDRYRMNTHGRGTLSRALRGLEVLQRHGVQFNTLTCVSAANGDRPLEVYRFLKGIGSRHMQFIPVVERARCDDDVATGDAAAATAGPPDRPTPFSIGGEQWGRFLIRVFDEWVRTDVGEIYVDLFELSLAKWLGIRGGACVHSETCGDALAIEHDGSVYACDHYVDPDFRLGLIAQQRLAEMAESPAQVRFGLDKSHRLPDACFRCPVLFACNGGCPKHRFAVEGGAARNHLCSGYLAYFIHVDPHMRVMADLYRRGERPDRIMALARS
jgi:uncharacterized protein